MKGVCSMKSTSEVYVVSMITDMMRDGHVNLDHFLQRESFQWSMKQRVRLIDTLMRGYPFPAIYAIKESEDKNDLTVLDGKQRLLTLKSYIVDEEFALRSTAPVELDGEEYDVNGLRFSELPEAVRRRILSANFSVITFTGYTVEDIYEIFDRLNNGTPLTKAEKCKPLMGDRMIARLREIMRGGFFEKTGLNERQLSKGMGYTVLIQSLMLIMSEGSTGFSSAHISGFLAQHSAQITDADYDRLGRLVGWLDDVASGVRLEYCRVTLTRMSIAPIIYVLSTIESDEAALARFKTNLVIFLSRDALPEDYRQLCHKSTDRAQVEGRVGYFARLAQPAPEA